MQQSGYQHVETAMGGKQTCGVGIEFDAFGIRGARVSRVPRTRTNGFIVEQTHELRGRFTSDAALLEGLGTVRSRLRTGPADTVVSCVSGKQVYAAQVTMRRLPDDEMRNALKFEIRKSLPFEIAGATIDYQYLSETARRGEEVGVIVTAVADALLNRHLRLLDRAGLKPSVVDTVPLAAANAFWTAVLIDPERLLDGQPAGAANVIVHVGPDMTTIIVDGDEQTFYHRTVYFTAGELYGDDRSAAVPQRERERRLEAIAEELLRSLSFYETNYEQTLFTSVHVLGPYVHEELLAVLAEKTGMLVRPVDLPGALGYATNAQTGTFDLAVGLAVRIDD